ncbi:MAG: DUF4097 family beta strand repeat-containing protein [Steroidobacter sp.]
MNQLVAQLLRVALLSCISATAMAQQCKFSSDRAANFTGTINKVVISAGPGSLKVTGVANGVSAKGLACASTEALLGSITLESRREGDIVYLTMAVGGGGMFSFNRYATLDLEITVPKTAQLNVTDTTGDIELSEVGATVIADDSGDQLLKNVNGDLDITADAGEIRVISVTGNVKLKDGSGGIDIEDVRGNVTITSDTSGDLSVAKVTGAVEILEDGAGDITVREVGGNVLVAKDGSGNINVTEVQGKFSVNSDSSGEILHSRVRGSVRIPAKT